MNLSYCMRAKARDIPFFMYRLATVFGLASVRPPHRFCRLRPEGTTTGNTGSGSVESSGEESSGGGSENQGTEDGGEMGE